MPDNALARRRADRAPTVRVPPVPAKAKTMIEVLLTTPGATLEYAAMTAQMPLKRAREYMKAAHVRAYFIAERRAVLDAVAAGNPLALKQVRDTSENGMAVPAAVRAIESMRNEEDKAAGGRASDMAPGVTIVFELPGSAMRTVGPPTIEGLAEELEAD